MYQRRFPCKNDCLYVSWNRDSLALTTDASDDEYRRPQPSGQLFTNFTAVLNGTRNQITCRTS